MRISRRQFLKKCTGLGIFGLAASYPFFIERYLVLINVYRIPVPNLPSAFNGFRLVQLTDLHYGFLMPLSLIEQVVKRANQLERDVIVCTGDYVHARQDTAEIDVVWPVLSRLNAPSGVFSILGNHDHWANSARSQYWLEQSGQNLNHGSIALERSGKRLWLLGAGDFWTDHQDLDSLLQTVPESDCRVVLAHNPDTADSEFSSRIDLMICGHTHGGQVVIPFIGPPVLPVRNKSYASGLISSPRGIQVFISRGIGWAVCPIRFNCGPEIAVLELVPEGKRE